MSARTLLKGIGSNSLAYVVNVVVTLKLSPIVVNRLGDSVFGLWTLLIAVVGYYGILDLGVRAAISHFVATYHARRDFEGVRRTLSTAMAALLVVAAVAALVTVVLAFKLTDWYPSAREAFLATSAPASARAVIYVLGFGFALSFPMAIFTTVLYAVQRIGLQNAIGISQTLVRALLYVWVLDAGYGI